MAGVSEATVSRVMNGVGPMKESTRERVLQAAKQLKYVPNALAQRLARRRSGNIGVILPFLPKVHLFSTHYFAEILSGIGEACQRSGYDMLLIFRDSESKRDYAKLFQTHKVDGCIILGSQDIPEEREALAKLAEQEYPFCLVNQRYPETSYVSVDADHEAGSKAAVHYLLQEKGCQRIAFVNGPSEYSNSLDRLRGYKTALHEAGLEVQQAHIFEGNYSRKSGFALAEKLEGPLRSGEIEAIFAANDRMAIGIMHGLRQLGLEAGRHYAIVGYDDSDGARIVTPPLSTVAVPFHHMGQLAVAQIVEQLALEHKIEFEQENAHEQERSGVDDCDAGAAGRVLPVRLVVRQT